MMQKVFDLSGSEYRDLIQETARIMNVQPGIVEKDVWVSAVLERLFGSEPYTSQLVFKGGTSLSKVYNVIERFSEDIDLIMNWELLGYNTSEIDPWDENRSKTQQDRLNKEMNAAAAEYISRDFVSWLQGELTDMTESSVPVNVRYEAPQRVEVQYDPAFPMAYVREHVLLEIGPLASWVPNELASITPYVSKHFPEAVGTMEIPVRATSLERAFWEKATILHQQVYHTGEPQRRYSRHYYDLYMMALHGVAERAIENIALLESVARFKSRFYPNAQSRYDLATPGTLRLTPPPTKQEVLRKDYRDMQAMFFRTPPSWEAITQELARIEEKINQLEKR